MVRTGVSGNRGSIIARFPNYDEQAWNKRCRFHTSEEYELKIREELLTRNHDGRTRDDVHSRRRPRAFQTNSPHNFRVA